MNEDKKNIMTRVVDILVQLDNSQDTLECVAFEILNSSDSIMNSALKLAEAVKESENTLMDETAKQAILNVKDCLKELSAHIENMSRSAHQNEESFAEQRESIEEIKQVIDYLSHF